MLHGPTGPYPTSEFEHSSIPATVKKIFNLGEFLTKRDAWAGTFEVVLNRSSPRTDCPGTLVLTLTIMYLQCELFSIGYVTFATFPVILPEPVRLRDTGPNEEAGLSEFQAELVQLGAVLNGDHSRDDIFPHKLVENMKVFEAADYVGGAFQKFTQDCHKAIEAGADESHIIICPAKPDPPDHHQEHHRRSKTFVRKILSCLVCDLS